MYGTVAMMDPSECGRVDQVAEYAVGFRSCEQCGDEMRYGVITQPDDIVIELDCDRAWGHTSPPQLTERCIVSEFLGVVFRYLSNSVHDPCQIVFILSVEEETNIVEPASASDKVSAKIAIKNLDRLSPSKEDYGTDTKIFGLL